MRRVIAELEYFIIISAQIRITALQRRLIKLTCCGVIRIGVLAEERGQVLIQRIHVWLGNMRGLGVLRVRANVGRRTRACRRRL